MWLWLTSSFSTGRAKEDPTRVLKSLLLSALIWHSSTGCKSGAKTGQCHVVLHSLAPTLQESDAVIGKWTHPVVAAFCCDGRFQVLAEAKETGLAKGLNGLSVAAFVLRLSQRNGLRPRMYKMAFPGKRADECMPTRSLKVAS